ncbi:MAG: Penicillin-binding protein 2 [Proteobacteria bacterium]|nr:MAG: Penicillin-binding protein 2 [Pseudomonadota bacterium]
MRPSARRYKNSVEQSQQSFAIIKTRLNVVVIALFIVQIFLAGAIISKAYQATQEPQTQIKDYFAKEIRRGSIYDQKGVLLATSLKVNSLYADPKMMLDVNDAIFKLKKVLPEIDSKKLKSKLSNKNRRFVWIKRNLSPKQAYQINALGVPGFAFKQEFFRTYPNGNLAAHILGYINRNGNGVVGVEKVYDEQLKNGEDVHLTIDATLQDTLRQSLAAQLLKTNASSAWAIALHPHNGSVLASVSLPDYDPNFYNKASAEQWKDRTISDVFEMGSINKTYTFALGFDKEIINLNSILDATRPIRIGKYRIRDAYPKSKWLSTVDAFKYSSNIATSRVADELTVEQQKQFYKELHLLEPLNYDLGTTTAPIIPTDKSWKRLKKMTLSYGYGLATTPLQAVAALSSIGNDGFYARPKFVKNTPTDKVRVVKDETVRKMKRLFSATVEEGTGRRARVKGYLIGGKTGTAEILEKSGEYNKKQNLATFIGFAPLDKPEFIVLVGVNSPQGKLSGGGSAAAPIFREFAEKAFAILNIRPSLYKMQDKGQNILKTNKGDL